MLVVLIMRFESREAKAKEEIRHIPDSEINLFQSGLECVGVITRSEAPVTLLGGPIKNLLEIKINRNR